MEARSLLLLALFITHNTPCIIGQTATLGAGRL
jgi:hypothetical protein